MSYDIFIGQAVIEVGDEGYIEATVRHQTDPGAPCFENDELTGKGNHRHPAYGAWAEWCRSTGLYDLFFDKDDGLMRQHPGTFLLEPEHLATIRNALDRWRSMTPEARVAATCAAARDGRGMSLADASAWPGFHPLDPKGELVVEPRDPMLARLIWLEWWGAWAVANCKIPAIHNY